MGQLEADALQAIIQRTDALPLWNLSNSSSLGTGPNRALRDIELFIALREADRDRLRDLHPGWDGGENRSRQYRCDALPDRISEAFSDLLYGEPPDIKAADEADQARLTELVNENYLPSELKRWAADVSSEGEQWWRIFVNLDISDVPQLEFHSRLDVFPYWVGRQPRAVAFFNELYSQENKSDRTGTVSVEVWRHVEIQTDGFVRNLLYKGSRTTLGQQLPLDEAEETRGMEEEWDHGLKVMLAGRIPNKLGRDFRMGISHYKGIRDQLLDLNEARSIMAENARLSAKKRMLVPTSALDENGNWRGSGDDIIPTESLNDSLDEKGSPAKEYAILEYNFDAAPIIAHINELEETALTRVGLNVQFVNGDTGEGSAVSGVALRTKLIPTTLAAEGLGKYWDDGLPKILCAMQQVDALPQERGGCGASWKDPETPPSVTRGTVLPEDPDDKANRHVTLVSGELESLKTAITDLHPEWTGDQVNEEIKQIKLDRMPFDAEGNTVEGGDEVGATPAADFTPLPNPAADQVDEAA